LEIICRCLNVIWGPGAQAWELQKSLGVRSLHETGPAAERAGYEVCYVDLPESISGFADVIEGKPHVVLNRAKSRSHQHYTLLHELAHHVLHLNSPDTPDQRTAGDLGAQELEAHMFSAVWVMLLAKGDQRNDLLRDNPELRLMLVGSLLLTALSILTALLLHFLSRRSVGK
jgi:hypothetical protein